MAAVGAIAWWDMSVRVLEAPIIATHGLLAVEDDTQWGDLREAHLAQLGAQRPAVA
jgi:hypothetical protein